MADLAQVWFHAEAGGPDDSRIRLIRRGSDPWDSREPWADIGEEFLMTRGQAVSLLRSLEGVVDNPWKQPCPRCGRDECAWHGPGPCDGEPLETPEVEVEAEEEWAEGTFTPDPGRAWVGLIAAAALGLVLGVPSALCGVWLI